MLNYSEYTVMLKDLLGVVWGCISSIPLTDPPPSPPPHLSLVYYLLRFPCRQRILFSEFRFIIIIEYCQQQFCPKNLDTIKLKFEHVFLFLAVMLLKDQSDLGLHCPDLSI